MRLIFSLSVLPLIAGCAGAPADRKTPDTATAKEVGNSYGDAELVSSRSTGRHAAIGKGESMAPVYSEETVLVFTPISYGELRPGMNIAYVNSEGRRVVHCLREKTAHGWIVAGLNNQRIDSELVTPKNLLGVVYVNFAPVPDESETAVPKTVLEPTAPK